MVPGIFFLGMSAGAKQKVSTRQNQLKQQFPLHLDENNDRITAMLDVVLYRPSRKARPRFYRVEIAMDLFSEVSVLREWGVKGGAPCETITSFGNLRDASHAADAYRIRAQKRGYKRA